MPSAQLEHRIEDICFRGPWFVSCICGFRHEWTAEEVKSFGKSGLSGQFEAIWLIHRKESGMTKK